MSLHCKLGCNLSKHPMFRFLPNYFGLFHVTARVFGLKQDSMTEETLSPIFKTDAPAKPIGRKADLLAAIFAGAGAGLSALAAIWFFIGFAENDTRLEHLTSALVLTLLLFAFAIIPFVFVCRFAWRAYQRDSKQVHLLWTLFLMLPWVGLGALTVSHTPLPVWCGLIIMGLALLLSLWALVSWILNRKAETPNTKASQQNDMQNEMK